MVLQFTPHVVIVSPSVEHENIASALANAGDVKGRNQYGDKWNEKLYPSEEKLRIWHPPYLDHKNLEIRVIPYQWADLQRMRQIQPVGSFNDSDPMKYVCNAIALTGNGLLISDDNQFIFHRKKGGAKNGSIHTFGGYILRTDISEEGDIANAILRELSEPTEIGLQQEEMTIERYFGTHEGMPSILWGFGTGAVYAAVRVHLSAHEIQQRFESIPREESLTKKLEIIAQSDLRSLENNPEIHPQTRNVIPTILVQYS
jgi:hypothetical protein